MAVALFALIGIVVGATALVIALDRRGAQVATTEPTRAAIKLSEFAIKGDLEVPPGPVVLEVSNGGAQVHNLQLDKGPKKTVDIPARGSDVLELGNLSAGTYELICTIPGHADSGMKTTLTVNAGAMLAAASTGHSSHGGDQIDYAAMDAAMEETIKKFPAKTSGKGNQPLAARTGADGAKEFDVTAEIIDWEVEPGNIVKAWAYNGMVPGPYIKVNLGDKVRFKLTNKLPMGTDVHFHGVSLPNSMDGVAPVTQPLIAPGQSFTYEFVAEKPAVAMYHAHHHAQMQVPNGLFGAFQIGDVELPRGRSISGTAIPADLKLAAEFPMVLNDAGVIGLSLNGKGFPATDPYAFKVGDWVLVHYMNEGLQVHPMHPHQFPQLVVARDGIPLDHPYFADTLTVAPGERYSVLMHVDKPGTWVWHCHILNHVEREDGMFGMVTALIAS
ncbi:MAG: multicopper oxidase domain-containing protein [Acidimicrobiales bacterium]